MGGAEDTHVKWKKSAHKLQVLHVLSHTWSLGGKKDMKGKGEIILSMEREGIKRDRKKK